MAAGNCSECVRNASGAIASTAELPVDHISVTGEQLMLVFPDSEFTVGFKALDIEHCQLTIHAVVRSPAPNLETWCTSWNRSIHKHACGAALVSELLTGRARFQRLVEEWLACPAPSER